MPRQLLIGAKGFLRAPLFLIRNRLWWTFLIPVLLWSVLASGMLWLSLEAVDAVRQLAAEQLGITVPATGAEGWQGLWDAAKAVLNGARDVLVLVVVQLGLWLLFVLVSKYLVLIVLSPLLAWLSERTEEILTGRRFPFDPAQFARDVLRGVGIALRNGLLELGINVLAWVLSILLLPTAPFWALFLWVISCWFYGFSMFDYVFERHRLGIRASARAARENRGMVLANGALFWLLMLIPFVGVVVAPILACTGAALAWHEASGKNRPALH